MSKSIICTCPKCAHEFLFKSAAKRPRPHCPRCHFWFYAQNTTTQNTQDGVPEKKQKKHNSDPIPSTIDFSSGLTEENIEKAIIEILEEGRTESKLRLAVDFYNKVRGTDLTRLEEPLDMEGFLLHEQSERKATGH